MCKEYKKPWKEVDLTKISSVVNKLTCLFILGESYNFNKYRTNYYNQKYDLNSIMHYRNWEFSRNGRNTIEAKNNPSLRLGSSDFTQYDLNAIRLMYRCSGSGSGPSPNPPSK